jgi:peptide/nickel transport system substrate-binding protein
MIKNIVNKLTVKNLIKLFCLVILFTPIDTIFADSHSPVYGGKLKSALASEGIRGFETWKDTTATETHIYSVIYDSFIKYDDNYNIAPNLFESWTTEDGITWIFNIRKGVKWHDGQDLTSNNFIDYINTVLDPKSGATTETVDIYKGSEYLSLDKHTLKLVLPSANVALLDSFTAQWLSRTSDFNPSKPIGTGPYKLKKWNRNQSIVLVKNENYWEKKLPYINELTFVMSPDESTRLNQLLMNEVDVIISVSLSEADKLKSNNEIKLIETPSQFTIMEYYMLMKNSISPFNNKIVRQAINHAIDREALLSVNFGLGELKSNPIPKGSWAFNPDAASYDIRNLAKAKKLMKEAGYDPKDAFSAKFSYWKEWPENLQVAQILQANLADIGISVELELLEVGQWVQTVLKDHKYEMALTALVPRWDPNDQFGNVYRTDDGAALEWQNAEFDKLWKSGRSSPDINVRKPFYYKAQEIAMDEVPAAILNTIPKFDASRSNVKNLIRFNRGDLYYQRAWIVK